MGRHFNVTPELAVTARDRGIGPTESFPATMLTTPVPVSRDPGHHRSHGGSDESKSRVWAYYVEAKYCFQGVCATQSFLRSLCHR